MRSAGLFMACFAPFSLPGCQVLVALSICPIFKPPVLRMLSHLLLLLSQFFVQAIKTMHAPTMLSAFVQLLLVCGTLEGWLK